MASAATAGVMCTTSTRYSARKPVNTSTSRSATSISSSQRSVRQKSEKEDNTAAEDHQPPSAALAGQHAHGQLEEAADQQRDRGQQPDLLVAQPQVAPDERERRSLGPVNQLVGERDRERDGENGKLRRSTSSETHAVMVRPHGRTRHGGFRVSAGSRPARLAAGQTSRRRW